MSGDKRKKRTKMENVELARKTHSAEAAAAALAAGKVLRTDYHSASQATAEPMAVNSQVFDILSSLIQEEEDQRLEDLAQGFSFRRKLSF